MNPQGRHLSEITIRHVMPDDAATLQRIYSQSDTQANTLHLPHASLQIWHSRLSTPQPLVHLLVACIGRAMRPGSDGARQTASLCHAGHGGRRAVGRALMQEMVSLCDNWLQVTRMELTVFVDNAPAIALYRRFGFEIEGTAKRFAMRHGELIDAHFMARLKS